MVAERGVWPPQERTPEKTCEQVVDFRVRQVVEQVLAVPKNSSQDRNLQGTVEQIPDDPMLGKAEQLEEVPETVSRDGVQERTAEQTVEAPDITLAEKIVEGPVTQTQQVVNTSVQHAVDTDEVEKHIIHEKINQVTRHVEIPLLQIVKKTVEVPGVPQLQCADQVNDVPVVLVVQAPLVQVMAETAEIPHLQITDQVVDVPVKLAGQVPRVLVVEKTTEIPQFGAAELLKFNTSKSGDEQIRLKEYVDRIKERSDLGDEDEKKTLEELNTEPKPLTKLMEHILADKVEMAMVSDRIVDSPCVPTTSEYGWSAKMERIMEAQALRDNSMISHMVSEKTMEVNPAAWERQRKQQQQQQQRESSEHQPTKKSTRQERGGERKEEEREAEDGR